MNNLLKVSAILLMSLGAKQCVSFETVSLDDGQAQEEEVAECGIPGTRFQGGDLMDGPVWWTGAGDLSLASKGGVYEITANGIGPKYTPFGQTLPGLDMRGDDKTGKLAIKITARSQGENYPSLALQFDDFQGFQTNAKRPTKRIHIGDDFKDYYFMLNDDVWVQSWPSDHAVNACLLSKIMLFINPGGPAYTGKLFIKEIKIIPQSEAGEEEEVKLPKGKDGGLVDDFENSKIDKWWANGYKLSVVDGKLKIDAENVGPRYEAFGRGFATINGLHANKLRVKARVEGEAAPELRIDLKDPDGYTTNARPATMRILPGPPGQFRDYTFRFEDRWLQTYPDMHDVDGERIVEFVCFINGGKAPFTGTVYIEEIEFINTGIPEGEVEEEEAVATPGKPLKDELDGHIYSWWHSGNLKLSQSNGALEVATTKDNTKDHSFGRAFQAVDFSTYPVLKVRMKVEKDCDIRVDLKDIDEHVTNASPVVVSVKAGKDYQDIYFDFKGKFKQAHPSEAKVNAQEILEAIFHINPDGNTYSGKVFVDSIESIKQVP